MDSSRPGARLLDAAYHTVGVSWEKSFADDPQQVTERLSAWARSAMLLARSLAAEQHRAPRFRETLDTFIGSATRLASRAQATAQDPTAWARVFAGLPAGSPNTAARDEDAAPEAVAVSRTEQPAAATQAKSTLEAHTRPDGTLDPERQALHDEIAERVLAGHQPQAQPVATFFGGGSASGKSALEADTADNARIDADGIKEMLPEYERMLRAGDERAAAHVHEESSVLAKRIESEAQRRRYNYILDGTGDTSFEKMAAKVGRARAAGYGAVGKYVTVDTDTAVERSRKRAQRSGRMVPETVMRAIHASVSDTFAQAADERLFDRLELLDNNEAAGPRVIARDDGTGLQVLDPVAYDRFLAKGEEGAYARQHRSADRTSPASETGEIGLSADRSAGHTAGQETVGRDRPGTGRHAGQGPVSPCPLGLQRGLTPEQPGEAAPDSAELREPGPETRGQAAAGPPVPGPHDGARSAQQATAPLANMDLAAELVRMPGAVFARWLSLGAAPPAAGDLDYQRPGAGSHATAGQDGIEITAGGPDSTRHGLLGWPQIANWIDKGVTPARLGIIGTASRLLEYVEGHREQLTAAGTCDPGTVAAELAQIRAAAIAAIVEAARRGRGTAVPVPPALPGGPAWHTVVAVTRPGHGPGKAENKALERLAALRSLVREPQPLTPEEVRDAIRRKVDLAAVARAMRDPAAMRAWISRQASARPTGGYDDSGRTWRGTGPDGLTVDHHDDDRAPHVIPWDDVPAWVAPGLTDALREELIAADDASHALVHREFGAVINPVAQPKPSAEEQSRVSGRLRAADDAAWVAVQAAPPPSPADFDRARYAARDTSPVQETLFGGPPDRVHAGDASPELPPGREISPSPAVGAPAPGGQAPEQPGPEQPSAEEDVPPLPARDGSFVPQPDEPVNSSDLVIAMRHVPGGFTRLLTQDKPPDGGGSRGSREGGMPDAGARQSIDYGPAGVQITLTGRRFRRHGRLSWAQVASWLDAGVTPARLGIILTADRLSKACAARRDELTAAGTCDPYAVMTELERIREDAVNAVISAALQAHGAGAPVPPTRHGGPAFYATPIATGPEESAGNAESAALERLNQLRTLVQGTREPAVVTDNASLGLPEHEAAETARSEADRERSRVLRAEAAAAAGAARTADAGETAGHDPAQAVPSSHGTGRQPGTTAAGPPQPELRQGELPGTTADGPSGQHDAPAQVTGPGTRAVRAPKPADVPHPASGRAPLTGDDILLGVSRLPPAVIGDLFRAASNSRPPEPVNLRFPSYSGERAVGEPDVGARESVAAGQGGLRIEVSGPTGRRAGLVTWAQIDEMLRPGATPALRETVTRASQLMVSFMAAGASFRAVGESRLADAAEHELRRFAAEAFAAILNAVLPSAGSPPSRSPAGDEDTAGRIAALAAVLPTGPRARVPAEQVKKGDIIGHPGYRFAPFQVTESPRQAGTVVEITGRLTDPASTEPAQPVVLTVPSTGRAGYVVTIPVPAHSLAPLFPAPDAAAPTAQPVPAARTGHAAPGLGLSAHARQPDTPETRSQEETVPPPTEPATPPPTATPAEPRTAPQTAPAVPAPPAADVDSRPRAGQDGPRSRAATRRGAGIPVTEELQGLLDAISERTRADATDGDDIRAAFRVLHTALGHFDSPPARELHPAGSASVPNRPAPVAPRMPAGDPTPLPGGLAGNRAAGPDQPVPMVSRVHHAGPAPARGDMPTALGDLLDLLGQPARGRHARAGGAPDAIDLAIADELARAMAEALARTRWYQDTPEWQQAVTACRATSRLVTVIREAAAGYWDEVRLDIRVRGFARTLAARTARAVSGAARAIAGRLERAGHRGGAAWRAVARLHQAAATFANRVIGYAPPGNPRTPEALRAADGHGQRRDRPGQPSPDRHAVPRTNGTRTPNAVAVAGTSFPVTVNRANLRQAAAAPTARTAASVSQQRTSGQSATRRQ